jgi:excisionase family DNA binding protein
MISFSPNFSPVILNNHISVKVAARYSGYSQQYLRRMMRHGKLPAVKVGQLWLIDKGCFDTYLEYAKVTRDERFAPK